MEAQRGGTVAVALQYRSAINLVNDVAHSMCCATISFRQSAYNLVCNAFFAGLAVADDASNAVLVSANKVSFVSRNALFGPPYADSVRGVSRIVKDGCVLRGEDIQGDMRDEADVSNYPILGGALVRILLSVGCGFLNDSSRAANRSLRMCRFRLQFCKTR